MLCTANAVLVDFEDLPENAQNLINEVFKTVLVAAAGAALARVYRRFGLLNAFKSILL